MLVLGRKEQERILIGNDIVITIVRVKGSRVQVGIEAPKAIAVVRDEVVKQQKGVKA